MKKVILVVLDGWGISSETNGNAIANSITPNMDEFMSYYPHTTLQASSIAVGLPWGDSGNSEVGHMIMGAGKIVYQNLPRVSLAIQDRSFFDNEALLRAINHYKKYNSKIHVMGLLGDGGVHSHTDHLYAILELLKIHKVEKNDVCIHVFTDGRDTNPRAAVKFISELNRNIAEECWPGRVTSIIGRYFAMDRNKSWERTGLAYHCLVNLVGVRETDPIMTLEKYYEKDITDEFVNPVLIADHDGNLEKIKENDSVIFFNIREDRARQITEAFTATDFNKFDRGEKIPNLLFTTMIDYDKDLDINVVFAQERIENPLGKIISNSGLKQLRIAETEKYAHVTYFFNGGREEPFKDEFRILIPSPSVAQYDQTPEMSADTLTDQLIKELSNDKLSFVLANYANADMVGHTGNLKATICAIEFIDICLGRLFKEAMNDNSTLIITGDHGNAEEIFNNQTGEKITEHSSNPVPFILINNELRFKIEREKSTEQRIGGMLSDIAPTILEIIGIEIPKEMTGKSLLDYLQK